MPLELKEQDNLSIIKLSGRLDVHYSSPLEKEIDAIVTNKPENNLIFNFQEVDYMSSTAIRIFIHLKKELEEENRKIKLCCMNKIVDEVFKITGLTSSFEIFPSESAAIESFK